MTADVIADRLSGMATWRREVGQWRETDSFQRALMLRDDADTAFRACEIQHGRIAGFRRPLPGEKGRDVILRGRVDVDFFILALNRLLSTAELAAAVADPRGVLPDAITSFRRHGGGWPLQYGEPDKDANVSGIRIAFEHRQNLTRRGGLGLASGDGGWYLSYRGRMFETADLLAAATDLHRAIRAAVDPEAFSDFHGNSPFIELRGEAERLGSVNPGAEIMARMDANMRRMNGRESG